MHLPYVRFCIAVMVMRSHHVVWTVIYASYWSLFCRHSDDTATCSSNDFLLVCYQSQSSRQTTPTATAPPPDHVLVGSGWVLLNRGNPAGMVCRGPSCTLRRGSPFCGSPSPLSSLQNPCLEGEVLVHFMRTWFRFGYELSELSSGVFIGAVSLNVSGAGGPLKTFLVSADPSLILQVSETSFPKLCHTFWWNSI
jgi:hypothetical protein